MSRERDWLLAGVFAGLVVGAVGWSGVQQAYRRDLFSRHPLRRLAALGYLAGRPSVASAQLLREYIAWERRPAFRRRAVRLLRGFETTVR